MSFWEDIVKVARCTYCNCPFNPQKDEFITYYRPQKDMLDFCRVRCLNDWCEEKDANA